MTSTTMIPSANGALQFVSLCQVILWQEQHAEDLTQREKRGAMKPSLFYFVAQHRVIIDILHMVLVLFEGFECLTISVHSHL